MLNNVWFDAIGERKGGGGGGGGGGGRGGGQCGNRVRFSEGFNRFLSGLADHCERDH